VAIWHEIVRSPGEDSSSKRSEEQENVLQNSRAMRGNVAPDIFVAQSALQSAFGLLTTMIKDQRSKIVGLTGRDGCGKAFPDTRYDGVPTWPVNL
jgi:hypothetical protein